MRPYFAILAVILSVTAFAAEAMAADTTPPTEGAEKGVRYKKGKDVNFEELLINGQLKRPEITVVTGNVNEGDDGLLRLREHFMDRIAEDVGEEIP